MTDITSTALPGPPAGWVVLAARFHSTVVDRLVDGAVECLRARGEDGSRIEVLRVAGAFELPQAAAALSRRSPRPVGIVALGAVVRGETPHFDYVCSEASRGLMDVALSTGMPIGFGLLTCDDLAQALARAGGDAGNKGWEAADAAFELASLVAGTGGIPASGRGL